MKKMLSVSTCVATWLALGFGQATLADENQKAGGPPAQKPAAAPDAAKPEPADAPGTPVASFCIKVYIMGMYAGKEVKNIFADGTVEVIRETQDRSPGAPGPGLGPLPEKKDVTKKEVTKLKMSPDEVKELLALIDQKKIMEMNGNAVNDAAALWTKLADAPSVELAFTIGGKSNKMSVYGLTTDAWRLVPDVPQMKDLKEVYEKMRAAGR